MHPLKSNLHPRLKNAPPKMDLHPLTSKGGAFVSKLGFVFKKWTCNSKSIFFIHCESNGISSRGGEASSDAAGFCRIDGRQVSAPTKTPAGEKIRNESLPKCRWHLSPYVKITSPCCLGNRATLVLGDHSVIVITCDKVKVEPSSDRVMSVPPIWDGCWS